MPPNGHNYTTSYNSSSSNGSYAYHERMNSLSRSESHSSRTHYEDFANTPSPKVMTEYARGSLQWDYEQPQVGRARRVNADHMGMHLLVETAVGDSSAFDILSIDELEDLKKEEANLNRRMPGLRRELALETKYRDAAKGFSRFDDRGNRTRGSSRMSQDEYAASVTKCENISGELYRTERRLGELREQRLKHTAGILQLEYEQRNGRSEFSKANGYQDSDEWDSGFSLTRFAPGGLADTEDGIMDIPGGHDPHLDATLHDLWTVLNSHDELLGTREMSNGAADEDFSIEAFSEKVQSLCSRAAGLSYELESEREARHVTEEAQKSNRAQLLEQLQNIKDRHQQSETEHEDTRGALDEAQNDLAQARQAGADMQTDHENLEAEVVRLQTELTMAKAELDSAYGTRAQRAAEQANEVKAQNETLQKELRELVTEHEALTQQGIEAEKEREKLESHIDQLRERVEGLEVKLSEERVHKMARGSGGSTNASTPASGTGGSNRTSEDPTSLRVMRSEFKKMMRDARAEHFRGLKAEQDERRRLEGIIRSLKKEPGTNSPGAMSPSTTLSPPPLGRSGLSKNNIASASLDLLPSFSSTASIPSRIFNHQTQQRHGPRTSFIVQEPAKHKKQRPETHNSTASSALRETLGNVSLYSLNPRYSSTALSANYGVNGLLSSLGRPTGLPSTRHSLSRGYSTATLFGLRNPSRPFLNRRLPLTQSRSVTNGQSSHNLLAHMEATANNNPSSASAQNAFYSALLRANMPEILVERYETGRYATNAACDAMYHRALERLGQASSAGATNITGATKGLSQEQLHQVSRAVAANARGGNTASPRVASGPAETGEKGNPVHVVVQESTGMTIFKALRFVAVWGLIAYFALVIITFAIEASGVLRRVGGPQNSEVKPEQQKARFSDVKGCEEAKEEMQEIVDFLRSPDKYNQLGGKLPKGVLMIGPPGTGKTLLARAVAGEAGVPFFYMSGSEFDEVYVGVGAKRVRELFANAKAKAPAIVFIDELDAVGGKRNERDAAYHMQTLNQMLTELDGFDQTSGVVFIAATNFPQMLDKALTRPGRFDRQVFIELPDVRGRIDILKHYMRTMQIATEVDASLLARGTPGFSGADLENLVNQAAVHASKIGRKKVNMNDLEWAKDRVMMGAEKKSKVIQEKDKLATAYHEAGHAIVGLFTENVDPLYKVTIIPRGGALGITHFLPEMDKVSYTKAQLEGYIDKAMGGKLAEEIVYGRDQVTSGCSSDLANATQIAYEMVMSYGMSDKLGAIAFDNQLYTKLSTTTKNQIEEEVRRILRESEERARKLVLERRRELEALAQGLMKYETLNKEEVEKLLRGEQLPQEEKPSGSESAPLKIPELPTPPIPIPGITSSSGTGGGGEAGGQAAGS